MCELGDWCNVFVDPVFVQLCGSFCEEARARHKSGCVGIDDVHARMPTPAVRTRISVRCDVPFAFSPPSCRVCGGDPLVHASLCQGKPLLTHRRCHVIYMETGTRRGVG